jgi:putative endonuclease
MNKRGGYRQRIGKEGEEDAVEYLEREGYFILERNFRAERGEIDIIARDGNTLVFVEVKTTVRGGFGEPEEWVNQKKQTQIGKVAMGYLQEKRLENVDCRFDVVAVTKIGKKTRIRHIEDAFWLNERKSESLF